MYVLHESCVLLGSGFVAIRLIVQSSPIGFGVSEYEISTMRKKKSTKLSNCKYKNTGTNGSVTYASLFYVHSNIVPFQS
jgi:hypothetical protein